MRGLTTAFSLIAVLCLFGCSGNGVHDAGDEEQEDANLQPAFVLKSIDAHATIHDGSAVNVVQNIATMELDDRKCYPSGLSQPGQRLRYRGRRVGVR